MHGYVARCPLFVLAWFLLVVVLAAGCTAEVSSAAPPGGGDRGEVTPEAPARGFTVPPDSLAGQPVPLTVYYLRTVGRDRYLVPERHPVRLAVSAPEAAVRELLAGAPVYPGSARPFPSGCHLLGFARDGSRAVVNLSREAAQLAGGPKAARLAVQALVWTVTRAADVRRVLVKVEGRTAGEVDGRLLGDLWGPHASPAGLTRDERVPVAPIALVEPVPGARVHGGRVVVRGEASVARGMVSLRLRDSAGTVAAQGFSDAAVGAPARTPFSGSLAFDQPARAELWVLEVFEASPVDGSVGYSVELPVKVGG
jgi:Immunoglobulin-like domain of bacterial spore germination/Sporulation and spore germination